MKDWIKKLYRWTEPIRVICAWMVLGLGVLLVAVAIVAFPAVMCANYSWWWMLAYVGYAAVIYFLYK